MKHIEKLLRENIRNIKPYSSARDEYKDALADMIFVDANENPFESGYNRYPDPQQTKVKVRLAEIKDVETSQILLGNGSDEVLDLIFRAFCEPNVDNVITLPPTYGMYSVLANINAIDVKEVPLDGEFQPIVQDILDTQNSNSKVLFVCSPNNPTANSFGANDIEMLINNFNGIVVIDEAYIDFSTEESWVNRLKDFPNLIVTQTLSKAYGLAGIRLGICYASDFIISVLNKIKPPYNVNQLTQEKALDRLDDLPNMRLEVDAIKAERERLTYELQQIDIVKKVFSTDANFILAKVDDANKRYDQLLKEGIVVRNRSNQIGCKNCLRFTVGTEIENQKLIKSLRKL